MLLCPGIWTYTQWGLWRYERCSICTSPSFYKNIKRNIVNNILLSNFKHVFWVPKRTVSLRQFFWVPTTYVLIEIAVWIFNYAYVQVNFNKMFTCKIVMIFLPICLNICLGCSTKPSQWDSLSTHNICFGWEIRILLSFIWRPEYVKCFTTLILCIILKKNQLKW